MEKNEPAGRVLPLGALGRAVTAPSPADFTFSSVT
ncbi:hypothetical protein CLV70_1552 [Pseudosporangium ferrugineum]|uniref:Uncharacterized protein n=1 Tax=Pseudosporangium ferrugineum TaxID=439699 RepID=A0A2T0R7B6_9ACTN|nr:hypothetical protein CLV70_1552 [Pseudosporangium ferrugineum]